MLALPYAHPLHRSDHDLLSLSSKPQLEPLQLKPVAVKEHAPRHHHDHAVLRPVKRSKLLDADLVSEALAFECCSGLCMAKLTLEQVLLARKQNNYDLNEQELTAHMAQKLSAFITDGHVEYVLTLNSQERLCVCRTAWRLFYGLSDYKLRLVRDMALGGGTVAIRVSPLRDHPKRDDLVGWLQTYLDKLCNPRKEGHWLLPMYHNFRSTYEQCLLDYDKQNQPAPSLGLLRDVWGHEYRGKIHSPAAGDWALCRTCAFIKAQLKAPDLKEGEAKSLQEELQAHHKDHQRERQVLETHRQQTVLHPERQNLIMIDETKNTKFPSLHPTNSVRQSACIFQP